MKNALFALIAIGAGALASDWLARLPVVHEVAGQIFQRGKLIALVRQRGIFEADLGARLREKQFCAGREDSDEAERVALREELIAGEALPTNAVTTNESERALVALRNQFADDRQFRVALQHSGGPVVLVLTRQSLPVIDRSVYADAIHLERGAYILADTLVAPQILLIGTGSEVHLLLEAKERMEQESIIARVISMPSWELFEKQDAAYKNRVLPKEIRKRIVVEAASPQGWEKYATDEGVIIGMTGFGESAPAEALMPVFGFTVDNILARARALLQASLV